MRSGDGTWQEALPFRTDKCSNDAREVIFAAVGAGDRGWSPAGPGTGTGPGAKGCGLRTSLLRLEVPRASQDDD